MKCSNSMTYLLLTALLLQGAPIHSFSLPEMFTSTLTSLCTRIYSFSDQMKAFLGLTIISAIVIITNYKKKLNHKQSSVSEPAPPSLNSSIIREHEEEQKAFHCLDFDEEPHYEQNEVIIRAITTDASQEHIYSLMHQKPRPNLNIPYNKQLPLVCALMKRRKIVAENLIEAGADAGLADGFGRTPLHVCWQTTWGKDQEFYQFLIDKGANPNCITNLERQLESIPRSPKLAALFQEHLQ